MKNVINFNLEDHVQLNARYGTSVTDFEATATMSNDTWVKARNKGVGGSDVANILGTADAFGSPLGAWYDKTEGGYVEDNESMFWGRTLEDTIRSAYAEKSGYEVNVVDAILTGKNAHEKANLDGLVKVGDTWGILEIKNIGSFGAPAWGTDADPKTPSKYVAQVQWYMYVTGLQYAVVVALIGGQKMVVRHLERDEDFINEASEVCGIFWEEHVKTKTAPKNTGSTVCAEILKKLNPPTDITATPFDDAKTKDLLDLWLDYSTHEKEFKDLKKKVEVALLEKIGSHQKATLNGKSVATYKAGTRNTVDSKKLKEAYPQAYADCLKTSVTNTFKISYKGVK